MKKIQVFFLIMIMFFLTSCKKPKKPYVPDDCNQIFPVEFVDFIQGRPLYITSLGQSIDIEMLVTRLNFYDVTNYVIEYVLDFEETQVEDNAVIFLVVGASIKGLGDSDRTIEGEIQRIEELRQYKLSKNLSYVTFHLGGIYRRGETSDSLIKEAFLIADLAIYLEDGNFDGYLCRLGKENNIPYVGCATYRELDNALLSLYNLQP